MSIEMSLYEKIFYDSNFLKISSFFHKFFKKENVLRTNYPISYNSFFFGLYVQSKVDCVLLHRKLLETLYLKWFFTKKFEIFEKNDFNIITCFEFFSKNKFSQGQIHPAHLIFDVLSKFEVKIDQKHDFDLFCEKWKNRFLRKFQIFLWKSILSKKFQAFFINRAQST